MLLDHSHQVVCFFLSQGTPNTKPPFLHQQARSLEQTRADNSRYSALRLGGRYSQSPDHDASTHGLLQPRLQVLPRTLVHWHIPSVCCLAGAGSVASMPYKGQALWCELLYVHSVTFVQSSAGVNTLHCTVREYLEAWWNVLRSCSVGHDFRVFMALCFNRVVKNLMLYLHPPRFETICRSVPP